jgi:hypothetical protein
MSPWWPRSSQIGQILVTGLERSQTKPLPQRHGGTEASPGQLVMPQHFHCSQCLGGSVANRAILIWSRLGGMRLPRYDLVDGIFAVVAP